MASRTLAQQRFLGEFNKTIEVLAAESLLSDEAVQTITEIVTRLRKHPDVVHGPSVRGTLAFYEILNSLSCLKGDLTRDCISKAALISLPPRISVRRNQRETDVVSDIVKEVLFDVRFFGKPDTHILPEPITDADLAEGLGIQGDAA